ncbi:FMN-binding negative transcriptional regulator [Pseudoalteromonas sp. MMG022]|uniref:FMN-binding negative transcriptional regulator n=1 Tax=Pseudoalteromonas sp. MMG022 TaxID=2909978 RepID=UPI001F24C70C|nr:FMN-binding negative transcriptional regulator [Pseudoalteromonas sp. MMG022]MCF6436695.1 FMN-binding negative transcriptional regulator [Pseudoalteromonas sp. MMG022]
MYPARYFQEQHPERLLSLVQQSPLASILFDNHLSGLNEVVYTPLVFDEAKWVFIGHVVKSNPLVQQNDSMVKLLFHGPNSYISPSHSEALTLPSWLYANVQIEGRFELVADHQLKRDMMTQITDHFEREFHDPWLVSSLETNKLDTLFKHIAFFTISIEQWHGNFKLSQNKSPKVKAQIMQSLKTRGNEALSELVGSYIDDEDTNNKVANY